MQKFMGRYTKGTCEIQTKQGDGKVSLTFDASKSDRELYVMAAIVRNPVSEGNWLSVDLFVNDMDTPAEKKDMDVGHEWESRPHDFIHIAEIAAGQPAIIELKRSKRYSEHPHKVNIAMTAIAVTK